MCPLKSKQATSARQIVRKQNGVEVGIGRATGILRAAALGRVGDGGIGIGAPVSVETNSIQGRIHDAQPVVLIQKRLLIRGSQLDVVDAFHVGEIGAEAGVGELSGPGRWFAICNAGRQIGEGIGAGVVVVLIAANESAEGEDGVGTEEVESMRARC